MENKYFESFMTSVNKIVLTEFESLEYKSPEGSAEAYIYYVKDEDEDPILIATKNTLSGVWKVKLKDVFGKDVDSFIFQRDSFFFNYFEQLSDAINEDYDVEDDDIDNIVENLCDECEDD